MISTRETVAATAERIIAMRPVLTPLIKLFEPLIEVRANLPKKLLPVVATTGLILPEFTEEYAQNGRVLVSDFSFKGFDPVLSEAAKELLPVLAQQEYLQPFIPTLKNYFVIDDTAVHDSDVHERYTLAEAYLADNLPILEKKAADLAMPAEALLFAFHFILATSLQALVMHSIPVLAAEAEHSHTDEDNVHKKHIAPWDLQGRWQEGYCPVCASFPSISYLDRALLDENNQFLAGGGGMKHLHCSLCGTHWHFKRGQCPACKEEGPDVMHILREQKSEAGERIDCCTKCNSYCPSVDLRVSGKRPNFDMMAIGMVYLDFVAAEQKLTPLTPSFWNIFNEG